MDLNTRAYFNSAQSLKMEVIPNEIIDGFVLNLGRHRYYFYGSVTPWNNCTSTLIASNKFLINRLLHQGNFPVPNARMILNTEYSLSNLIERLEGMKFPLVAKPMLWSVRGIDVTCNIPNINMLHSICAKMLEIHPAVQIEEYYGNGLQDYRILIFQQKIIGVIARFPATVAGNGKDSVKTLVENENLKRSEISELLKPITFDFESKICLQNQNMSINSIPPAGKIVNINYTCNASRGGTFKALSTTMCKQNRKLFLRAAQILELDLVGLDVRCKSLNQPLEQTGGIIIEANYNPSIRIHEEGIGGTKNRVTLVIMRSFIFKHPFRYLVHLMFKTNIGFKLLMSFFIAVITYIAFLGLRDFV